MVLQHSSLDSDTFSLSGPLSLSAIQLQLQLKMITQRWDPPSWMIYAPFCHILVYTQLCSVSRHWEGLSSHQITQRQKKFQTFPVVNLAWEPWLSISYFSFYICSIWYCYTVVAASLQYRVLMVLLVPTAGPLRKIWMGCLLFVHSPSSFPLFMAVFKK